jgi:cyclopropane-fatty-acyl-phospholipid synthase
VRTVTITRLVDRLAERFVRDALAACDVEIGQRRPWDLAVHDPSFYRRLLINPAFQMGQTYMDGLWDCEAIDELFERLFSSRVGPSFERGIWFQMRNTHARLTNRQSRERAEQVTAHYDIGIDLYERMLDPSLCYTCAYFVDAAEPLAEAQRRKLALVCDKLDLRPGETLLDIGCGFGGLAAFAAERYGVRVLGVTNSRDHHRIASERHASPRVEFLRLDYRDLPGLRRRFDKIASIEMIEAVGPKNFGLYMDVVHRCLAPGGRFLLQSFISDTSQTVCNEWFNRYIFPNGVSPSLAQLAKATRANFGMAMDIHDIGPHYAPTLMAWDRNATRYFAESGTRYDARFQRMWHFYLRCLAGVFRARALHLCQLLYTSSGDVIPSRERSPLEHGREADLPQARGVHSRVELSDALQRLRA